jgi:hypothetical protein
LYFTSGFSPWKNSWWPLYVLLFVSHFVYTCCSVRLLWGGKRIDLCILKDLHALSPKLVFSALSVCASRYLLEVWTDFIYLFAFYEFIHQRSMPGECGHYSPKIGGLQRGPQSQNEDFLKNGYQNFY